MPPLRGASLFCFHQGEEARDELLSVLLEQLERDVRSPRVVVVFSDYVCPWCYFSLASGEELQKKWGIVFKRYPFQILPKVSSDKGLLVADYYNATGEGAELGTKRSEKLLQTFTKQLHLPYKSREKFYQSRLAHILYLYAGDHGFGNESFHRAIYIAQYGERKNIADVSVLHSVLRSLGKRADVRSVLEEPTYRRRFNEHMQLNYGMGIEGVPCFIYMGRSVNGYMRPEHMLEFIDRVGKLEEIKL